MNLSPGTVVSGYKIIKVLGIGGFGVTYLAADVNLKKKVAIKEYFPDEFCQRVQNKPTVVPRRDKTDDYRWGLERFLDEGRTLVQFSSPYLVSVLGYYRENNTAYLVMDYIAGSPIDHWSKHVKTPSQLIDVFAMICEGLKVIHAKGFLHRDIKPDNILINKIDDKPVIIDFGSARRETANRTVALVTPYYSPVEQYASDTEHGPYTDIYSLAASFYRVIKGSSPPDAPSRVLSDKCTPLAGDKDLTSFPTSFLKMIDKGMAPLPRNRPQSIDALISIGASKSETEKAKTQLRGHKSNLVADGKLFVWSDKEPVRRLKVIDFAIGVCLIVFFIALINISDVDENTNYLAQVVPQVEPILVSSQQVFLSKDFWTPINISALVSEIPLKNQNIRVQFTSSKQFRFKTQRGMSLSEPGGMSFQHDTSETILLKSLDESGQNIQISFLKD